ncbi:hypothetical protein Sjap_001808 [Stephania japonica]|uniref:Uncharacterized protein n=1 Tax=Stephania japonica TaxID=461633 RepID=A0AAP0PRV7_9MAGN
MLVGRDDTGGGDRWLVWKVVATTVRRMAVVVRVERGGSGGGGVVYMGGITMSAVYRGPALVLRLFIRLCSNKPSHSFVRQISSPSFAFEINGYQLGSKLIEALLHQISSPSLALSQISHAAISRPVSDLSRGHLLFENSYNIDPSCNVLNKRVLMRVTSDVSQNDERRSDEYCDDDQSDESPMRKHTHTHHKMMRVTSDVEVKKREVLRIV